MSIKAMTRVFDESEARLGARLVLLALADFSNDDGRSWPSVATIARKARLSPRQVQRILRDLETEGELVVEEGAGPHGCNMYRIVFQGGDNLSPVENVRGDKSDTGGVTFRTGGVTNRAENVSKMSPEPLVNHQVEPSSLNRQDARSQKRKRLTLFPEGFGVSPEMRSWAIERGLSDAEVTYESERFEGWAIAKGAQYVDWVRAWQNWMVKSARDAAAGSPGRRAGGPRMSDTAGEDRSQWSEADWFKD